MWRRWGCVLAGMGQQRAVGRWSSRLRVYARADGRDAFHWCQGWVVLQVGQLCRVYLSVWHVGVTWESLRRQLRGCGHERCGTDVVDLLVSLSVNVCVGAEIWLCLLNSSCWTGGAEDSCIGSPRPLLLHCSAIPCVPRPRCRAGCPGARHELPTSWIIGSPCHVCPAPHGWPVVAFARHKRVPEPCPLF